MGDKVRSSSLNSNQINTNGGSLHRGLPSWAEIVRHRLADMQQRLKPVG